MIFQSHSLPQARVQLTSARSLPKEIKTGIAFAPESYRRATDRYARSLLSETVVVIATSSNEVSLSAQELPNCQSMPKVSFGVRSRHSC